MAWWDHEELKSSDMRSDRYKVSFPSGYSPAEVAEAQRRLDMTNQDHEGSGGGRLRTEPMGERRVPRMINADDRKELESLLKATAGHVMTPQEERAQRRSWLLGEYLMQHPDAERTEALKLIDAVLARHETAHHRWKGIHKLTEEMGELGQVIGKTNVFPDGVHPDGGPPLAQRFSNELTDVEAAIQYFRDMNNLQRDIVRYDDKLSKFRTWGLSGVL